MNTRGKAIEAYYQTEYLASPPACMCAPGKGATLGYAANAGEWDGETGGTSADGEGYEGQERETEEDGREGRSMDVATWGERSGRSAHSSPEESAATE